MVNDRKTVKRLFEITIFDSYKGRLRMGNLAEEFTGRLVRDKEVKSYLKVRSNAFVFETVDKRLQSDYDPAEWLLHKTNKKSVVLKKQKPHHVMFEDRVWTILAKMVSPL